MVRRGDVLLIRHHAFGFRSGIRLGFRGLVLAYLYNYDGSGEEGDDLYFRASKDGNTYTFTVESYLCDKDSDVYKAVKELSGPCRDPRRHWRCK